MTTVGDGNIKAHGRLSGGGDTCVESLRKNKQERDHRCGTVFGVEWTFHTRERARAEAQKCGTVQGVQGAEVYNYRVTRVQKLSRTRF